MELRLAPTVRPDSRFQLLPLPVVSPGKCACCGAPDRPVVDFGMTIQFYGAVLLCVTCMTEAAAVIDMVPAVELIAAERVATSSFSEQLTQLGMRTITDDQFESITMAFSGLSDALLHLESVDLDLVAETMPDPNQGVLEFDGFDSGGNPEIVGVFNRFDESEHDLAVGEGPDIVPADNGNGNDIFSV